MEEDVRDIEQAAYEGQKLYVKREGPMYRWHARTADGALIYVDRYRHDLQAAVKTRGYTYEMIDED